MKFLILVLVLIFFLINLIDVHVLVYDTEVSDVAQYAVCIYWVTDATFKYCIRGNQFTDYTNKLSDDCTDGSEKWFFHDLLKQNISPAELLSWSSGVQMTDDYADYYYNKRISLTEEFLCNCSLPGTFGLRCEFEFLHEALTFEDAIVSQFEQKREDRMGMQRHGNILCYEAVFECDFGLLCLDWRNICDGEQQCMDGTDEENCDLLEFNECEDNEYRCMNGMCINEEYWIDGM